MIWLAVLFSSVSTSASQFHLQWKEIYAIMSTYFPSEYAGRGDCWARAPFVAMELAVQGISSRPVIISACTSQWKDEADKLLVTAKGQSWLYHTAPLVTVDGEALIIDPTFSVEPIPYESWLQDINLAGRPFYTVVNRDDHFTDGSGKPLMCGMRSPIPEVSGELPKFLEINIPIFCSNLWSDIENLTSVSPEEKQTMKKALLERTIFLWKRLKEMDLLYGLQMNKTQIKKMCSAGAP